MQKFHLTRSETEIMELLWHEGQALASAEIVALSEKKSWKASSIHILLNSLLDKGVIEVNGFVKTGKHYGRTFSPTITREGYLVMQALGASMTTDELNNTVKNIFSLLIQQPDITSKTLDEMDATLKARRLAN